MSYESEQIEFAKELETLKVQVEYMDKYFTANPNAKNKQYNRFGIPSESTALRWQSEKILREKYQDYQTDYSLEYLNYKILKHRKAAQSGLLFFIIHNDCEVLPIFYQFLPGINQSVLHCLF